MQQWKEYETPREQHGKMHIVRAALPLIIDLQHGLDVGRNGRGEEERKHALKFIGSVSWGSL